MTPRGPFRLFHTLKRGRRRYYFTRYVAIGPHQGGAREEAATFKTLRDARLAIGVDWRMFCMRVEAANGEEIASTATARRRENQAKPRGSKEAKP